MLGGEGAKLGVESEGLSSESIDAVLDGGAADVDRPTDGAQAHGARVPVEEVAIIDDFLGVVVERKGLGREGFAAGAAFEAGDGSEGLGVVMSRSGEPGNLWGM